ncbi:MAG TPA: hypothetical protein VKZ75_06925 [Cyclobacteriaceae bacterium]|nr:hypothetical protein [Cyclobacteriaceae bacterium]
MKTQKLAFLTALLAMMAIGASAQDYVFKVLANKGTNEVKSGNSWEPLKVGTTLKAGDEVRVGSNAYVGLVHNSGKPLEVKAAAVYKVSDLESQVGTSASVLEKYTDFILSSNEGQGNRLTATGAVHRDVVLESAQIKVNLPEKDFSAIFSNTAVVRWDGGNVKGPYVVTVRNMFEDILVQAETNDNRYVINLDDEKFANEVAWLVEVSAKADAKIVSPTKLIKRLPPAENKRIAAELKQLEDITEKSSAMSQYVLANFFEKNNLVIDAIMAYEEAVKLEPEVPMFREQYDAFLQRYRLQ